MKKTIWKDILGFEGMYQVSNKGQVKSISSYKNCRSGGKRKNKGRVLKGCIVKKGYVLLGLSKYGVTTNRSVHRLVAMTFIPNPLNLPEVNHKDCNKANNHVDNLEWTTRKGNAEHAVENNLIKCGLNHCKALLDIKTIRNIRADGKSGMKICHISRKYNRSWDLISGLLKGYTYKNVI